jgi:hypothetical protein
MAIKYLSGKRATALKSDILSDSLGSSADGVNTGITLSGLGNTAANDVAHFEESSGILNKIIGEKITSGNEIIGRTVTKLGFKLYRMDSGTFSSSDTLTFGVWDNATGDLKTSGSFGTVRIDSLAYNSASNVSHCEEVSLTHSGSGVTIAENDIIGVRIDIDNASAKRVEVAQHDTGSPYANGGRCIFDQGDDNPSFTAGKDIWFKVYQGKLGTGAYSLNGTSSHVTVGSTSDWNFVHDGSGATVSAWVYRNGSQTGNGGIFVTEGGQSTTTGFGLGIRSGGNAYARTINTSNSWQVCEDTSSSVSTGEWHHILATIDSTSIKLYVDGTLNSSHTISGTLKSGNSSYRAVGRAYSGSAWSYLNGKLDDMGIWKRVLTATEIGKLVNNNDDGSTGWTFKTGGTASYEVSGGKIKLSPDNSGTTTGNAKASVATYDIYSELGNSNLANTWVLRATVDTVFNISGNDAGMVWNVGCCDSPASTFTTNQDENGTVQSIQGLRGGTGNSGGYQYHLITSWQPSQSDSNSTGSLSTNTNETKYIEVIRTSVSSASVKIYSNSDYSDTPTTISISSFTQNPANLRYIFARAHQKKSTVANYGRVYDIKLWNNTTTASGDPTVTVSLDEGDAQLVSSLTNKSELKANYTMDTATEGYGNFDGNGDVVTFSSNGIMSGDFTMAMHFYYSSSQVNNYPTFFQNGASSNDRIQITEQNNNKFQVYANSQVLISDDNIVADKWQHLALTGDGTSWKLYLDGTVIKTGTGTATRTDTSTKSFGGEASGSYFTGGQRNFCIYNRALSASEITSLSNETKLPTDSSLNTSSSLKVYCPMWANFNDLSGNSVSMSVNGDASIITGFKCPNDYSDASPIQNSQTNTIVEATDNGKHYIWNATTSTWTEVA